MPWLRTRHVPIRVAKDTCAHGAQVYGDQDRLFLPSMLGAAASGRLRIFGAGDNLISWWVPRPAEIMCVSIHGRRCHVDNCCHAHILAAAKLAQKAPVGDECMSMHVDDAQGVAGEFFIVTDGGATYLWDSIAEAVRCELHSAASLLQVALAGLPSIEHKFHLTEVTAACFSIRN